MLAPLSRRRDDERLLFAAFLTLTCHKKLTT